MCKNEWHDTRTCQHEPSTFLKRETTRSLSSEYSVANVDDSTRIERLITANDDPSYRMSICRRRQYFLRVLQIDIRYDGSSFVVSSRSIRIDSCRFDNIFNSHAEYFLSLLQIDVWYAFPCHKRWFLRPPVSQHHLAANRLPV